MDDYFGEGARWIYLEESRWGNSEWNKYFSQIDFDKNYLTLYKNEKMRKALKQYDIERCEFLDAVKMKGRPCTIQLIARVATSKKQKTLYISSESLRQIDEMKVDLERCEGSFEGLAKKGAAKGFLCFSGSPLFSGGEALRLEYVDVEEWTKKDVLEWISLIKKRKTCGEAFKANDVDGCILVELDEQNLLAIGVPPKESDSLMFEIKRMKKMRTFSRSRFTVSSKFHRLPGFTSQGSEGEEFNDMIDSLCDASKLKHRFLNTADLKAHTLEKNAMGEKMMKIANCPLEKFKEANIKVKIVVTEILHSNKLKNFRKLVSPIVSAAIPQLQNDFGFFHTAVIIGPWYLEWTDSEIIIPKRMISGNAIISADIDTINVPVEGLKIISDRIADVVVKWNTKYKYKNLSQKSSLEKDSKDEAEIRQGNCQDFVDEVLHSVGINIDFSGALGGFIKKMRTSGKCTLEFAPSKDFRKRFGIEEKSWTFKTHEELDSFCVNAFEECLEMGQVFPSEWSLLKSFDRAFWLRHLKMPEDPRYTPLPAKEKTMKPFDTGCPFDDPRNTKSYR